MTLTEELTSLLNKYSAENGSNTPDYILAAYLLTCLGAFNAAVQARQEWYGKTADSIEAIAAVADKVIKRAQDICPVHDELWIEGTPCECGGRRVWHSGLGSTTTDVHWRCQKCGRDKYVDGIDS